MKEDVYFKTFEDKEEYILETDGTNLLTLMANKYVDKVRTISNDITEINEVFGIEAARQALYNEIDDILNSSTSVNHRHIALLVDTMTCRGYLLSIDRHGINRSDIGPLAKCSFEETSDILIKAGVFGELDKVNGVSANIMLGQIAKCGTGDSEVILDESKLLDISDDEETQQTKNVEDLCDLSFQFEKSNQESTQINSTHIKKKLIIK